MTCYFGQAPRRTGLAGMTLVAVIFSFTNFLSGSYFTSGAVAPRTEFGSLSPALERLEGVMLGLVASVVAGLWPRFPVTERPARAPEFPGELDR